MVYKKIVALVLSLALGISSLCFAVESAEIPKPMVVDIDFTSSTVPAATADNGFVKAHVKADVISMNSTGNYVILTGRSDNGNNVGIMYPGSSALSDSKYSDHKYIVLEEDVMQPIHNGDGERVMQAYASNGTRSALVQTSGGKVFLNGTAVYTGYQPNTWYNIKLLLDFTESKIAIYINGTLAADNYNFYQSANNFTYFEIYGSNGTKKVGDEPYKTCYDNIRVSAFETKENAQAVINSENILYGATNAHPQSAADYLEYKLDNVLNFTGNTVDFEAEVTELKALLEQWPNREIIAGSGNEKINDIIINAPSEIILPPKGETVTNSATLSASLKDQYNQDFMGNVKWEVLASSTQGTIDADTGILTIPATAQEGTLIVKAYDEANDKVCAIKKITLKEGIWILKDGDPIVSDDNIIVNVKVLPAKVLSGISLNIEDLSDNPIDIGVSATANADTNGKVSFVFTLDGDAYNTGDYPVEISHTDADMSLSFDLYFVGNDLRTTVLAAIASVTADKIYDNVFTPYSNVLKIDVENGSVYYELSDKSTVHSAIAGKTFTTIREATAAFNEAVAIECFKEATDSKMEAALTKNNSVFSLDLDGEYTTLKDKANLTLVKYSSTVHSVSEVKTLFDKTVLITKLNSATRNQISQLVEENLAKLIQYGLSSEFSSIDTDEEVKRNACLTIFDGEYDVLDNYITAMNAVLTAPDVPKKDEDDSGRSSTIRVPSIGGGGGGSQMKVNQEEEKVDEGITQSSSNESFSDVAENFWAYEEISTLSEKGIINGKSEDIFAPNDNVTREEFIKMILLAFHVSLISDNVDFRDVCPKQWYYIYVVTAQKKNIALGISDELFGVGSFITRQDAATILYRCANQLHLGEVTLDGELTFADKDAIAPYALSGVEFAEKSSIMNGVGDRNFEPQSYTTRAMAAKIICNAMYKLEDGQQ